MDMQNSNYTTRTHTTNRTGIHLHTNRRRNILLQEGKIEHQHDLLFLASAKSSQLYFASLNQFAHTRFSSTLLDFATLHCTTQHSAGPHYAVLCWAMLYCSASLR